MYALANQAYGTVQKRTASPKEIEYALFQQITEALCHVAQTNEGVTPARADALIRNAELWNVLALTLAGDENALPDGLRAELISLSYFVRKTTRALLSGEGDINDLIEINQSIMAGLKT